MRRQTFRLGNRMSRRTDGSLDLLMVLPSLDVGGAERVAITLANGLARFGAAPRLLLMHREGALRDQLDPDVPVTVLGRSRTRGALVPLVRHLRADPPEVLFSTHQHVNIALCGLRGLIPQRTRLVLREPTYAPVTLAGRSTASRRRLQRMLYSRAALLLASSEVLAEDLRELTAGQVALLPNPVDEAHLRALAKASAPSTDVLSEPPQMHGRRFVSVGRLSPEKAMDELLVAFAAARDAHDTLDIVGDGPERARLARLVSDLGMEHHVRLLGVRPDHPQIVAAADIFVLASHHEGMPNAVLEALAVGTPVLATTDLVTLAQLARTTQPDALRLVERSALVDALAAVARLAPRASGGAGVDSLRPSLLPDEHRGERVVLRLLDLLNEPEAAR